MAPQNLWRLHNPLTDNRVEKSICSGGYATDLRIVSRSNASPVL
jgi:hypothetical protein